MLKSLTACALAVAFVMALPAAVRGSESAREVGSAIVARLCQQIEKRKMMVVDKTQTEIIWSDGAMLEVAGSFPAPLQQLISASSTHRDMRAVIARLRASRADEWKDASIGRSPRGEGFSLVKSSDGKLSVNVSSVYMDYLRARYPKARVQIRGEIEPVIFIIGDSIRATVMPVK